MANTVPQSNTARQTTAPQANFPEHFQQQYQSHLKHLKLKGLQPKTIDAYLRNGRRAGCALAWSHQRVVYDLLMQSAWERARTQTVQWTVCAWRAPEALASGTLNTFSLNLETAIDR